MTIGQRIKQTRTDRKMTMEELGRIIGVRRATISRYESGEIAVNSPKIEAIADALGVTPGYLMGWTDHPDQMDLYDMPGMTEADRASAYADSTAQYVQKSEKRRELEQLVASATEEELDKILQIIELVNQKK